MSHECYPNRNAAVTALLVLNFGWSKKSKGVQLHHCTTLCICPWIKVKLNTNCCYGCVISLPFSFLNAFISSLTLTFFSLHQTLSSPSFLLVFTIESTGIPVVLNWNTSEVSLGLHSFSFSPFPWYPISCFPSVSCCFSSDYFSLSLLTYSLSYFSPFENSSL